MDQPAGGVAADLARVEGDGPDEPLDGPREVDVVEDDGGPLAAEFQLDRHEVPTAGRGDQPAHVGRAGEREALQAGMGGQRGPGNLPQAGDDVDYAVGNAHFAGEPRQIDRRQRRVLGRLDDHGVARRQGRGDAPADQQEGEVPGEDESARAPGEPHRPGFVPGRWAGPHAPRDVQRHLGEVPHRLDEVRHVAGGLGEDLAGVERLDLGDDRAFASTASARRCSSTARSAGDMVAQPERWKAAAAARTAASTSSGCIA